MHLLEPPLDNIGASQIKILEFKYRAPLTLVLRGELPLILNIFQDAVCPKKKIFQDAYGSIRNILATSGIGPSFFWRG